MFFRTTIIAIVLLCICCERTPQNEESSSGEKENRVRRVSSKSHRVEGVGGNSIRPSNDGLAKLLKEREIYSEVLGGEVSVENLESLFELVDNGDLSEDEFEELLASVFEGIELAEVKELVSLVGRRISASTLPNSATVFSEVLAKNYHERTDWNSGDVLESMVIEGPYEGLLIMEVGQKMVSGDDPTRAFFELLESDFEGRSKSDYGPLVRFSVSKLTASDLPLIEQVPINRYDDFGGMIVGAVAKKLVWNASEEAVEYILKLPDSDNREVAVFELAKLSVFLGDIESARDWFSELKDKKLQKVVNEFASQKGLEMSE